MTLPKNFGIWERVDNKKKLPFGVHVPTTTPGTRSFYKVIPQNKAVILVSINHKRKREEYYLSEYRAENGRWVLASIIWRDIETYDESKSMLMRWMKSHP
jgi:hypothetical protein